MGRKSGTKPVLKTVNEKTLRRKLYAMLKQEFASPYREVMLRKIVAVVEQSAEVSLPDLNAKQ